jgi:hypothetical protein
MAEVDGGRLLGLQNRDLSDNMPYTAPQRRSVDGSVIGFIRLGGRTPVRRSAPGHPAAGVESGP